MNNLIINGLPLCRRVMFIPFITGMALLMWATFCVAGQSTTALSFSATFMAGTCDITVTPSSINWGSVSSSDIKLAGEAGVEPRDLAVSYTNCTGYGRVPKLKVSGTTMTAGIPLFTRTEGAGSDYALGYGVRLVSNSAPQTPLGDGDTVNVGTPGERLSELESTQTAFQGRLSCGNNCDAPSLHGGALSATVTIQFLYE